MIALVSSPYFMALGGIVTLDMGLTLWTTATLCAYLLAERAPEGSRARRRWMLAAWAAMALAVLSKGLVGIVFPAAALGLRACCGATSRRSRASSGATGLVVFLAIAAPWFVAVSLREPRVRRVLLRPRALPALPHHDAPAHRAVVVLPADPRSRASCRGCSRCPRRSPTAGAREAPRARPAAAALRARCARLRGGLLQRLGLQAAGLHPARLPAARAGARALPRRGAARSSPGSRCAGDARRGGRSLASPGACRRRARAVDARALRAGAARGRSRARRCSSSPAPRRPPLLLARPALGRARRGRRSAAC